MKRDLLDMTFVIPVRVDSKERKQNLKYCVEHLLENFNTNIILVESDKIQKLKNYKDYSNVKLIFEKTNDLLFHRTHLLNLGFKEAKTPFVANYDGDAYLNPEQIEFAVEMLRKGETQFIIPYDGHCYEYMIGKGKLYLMNPCSVGGAFFANKKDYEEIGYENENFISWGHEDNERITRLLKFKKILKRTTGSFLHLCHPRGINSCDENPMIEENKKEHEKVIHMSLDELKKYVRSWKWLK